MPKQTKLSPDEAVTFGNNIHLVAVKYRTDLEPRLEPGTIDHLGDDVSGLRGDDRGAAVAKLQKVASTTEKTGAAEQGFSIAHVIREAIREKHRGNKTVLTEFGIGNRMVVDKASSVSKALQAIATAAANYPTETKAAGILPEDLTKAAAALVALDGKTDTQATKKMTSKQATASRVKTQRRIEEAAAHILSIAGLAFQSRPDVLKEFTDLVPHAAAKAKVKPDAAKKTDEPKK